MTETQAAAKKQRFADTRYCGISKEQMVSYLCRLWRIDPSDENNIILPIPNRVGLTAADLVYKKGTPNWGVLERVKYLSQDDPLWHKARVQPRLKTASILADALCMRDPSVATRMKVSQFMVASAPFNAHWDDFMTRDLHPTLPKPPLDSLMGAVFTTNGKEHETNVHCTFCAHNPHLRSREQGLTYLTPAILERYPLFNKLTGERFTYETLLSKLMFAASPDTVFTDIRTGQQFNGEWKAATNYLPCRGKDVRPGVDFFLSTKAKPYDYIRSYYVPQAQLQLLVCENDISYWGCWTLGNGMRTWIIKRSKLYLEMMFTILLFIQVNFADHQKPLPLDYFNSVRDTPIGRLHDDFIELTAKIINNKEPTIAHEHEFYHDTHAINNQVLGYKEGYFPPMRAINFPELPPELPAYAGVGLVLHELLPPSAKNLALWTDNPRDMHVRCVNLTNLMAVPEIAFLKDIVETNILVGLQPAGLDADKDIMTHVNVCMYRVDRAERFILEAAMTSYRLRDGYVSFNSLMKDMDILGPDATTSDRARTLMQSMNTLVESIELDTVYGIHPPTVMFDKLKNELDRHLTLRAEGVQDNTREFIFILYFVWSYYMKLRSKLAEPANGPMIEPAPEIKPNKMDNEVNTISITGSVGDDVTKGEDMGSLLEPAQRPISPSAYLVENDLRVQPAAESPARSDRKRALDEDEESTGSNKSANRSKVGMLSPVVYTASIIDGGLVALPAAAVLSEDDLRGDSVDEIREEDVHVADLTGETGDVVVAEPMSHEHQPPWGRTLDGRKAVWTIVEVYDVGVHATYMRSSTNARVFSVREVAEHEAKTTMARILGKYVADARARHVDIEGPLLEIIATLPSGLQTTGDHASWFRHAFQSRDFSTVKSIYMNYIRSTGTLVDVHEFIY